MFFFHISDQQIPAKDFPMISDDFPLKSSLPTSHWMVHAIDPPGCPGRRRRAVASGLGHLGAAPQRLGTAFLGVFRALLQPMWRFPEIVVHYGDNGG